MTGTGTFEGYVGTGAACAATPDGRLDGQPIASDCSVQPYPQVSMDILRYCMIDIVTIKVLTTFT